jgi:hypothetical protein
MVTGNHFEIRHELPKALLALLCGFGDKISVACPPANRISLHHKLYYLPPYLPGTPFPQPLRQQPAGQCRLLATAKGCQNRPLHYQPFIAGVGCYHHILLLFWSDAIAFLASAAALPMCSAAFLRRLAAFSDSVMDSFIAFSNSALTLSPAGFQAL